MRGNSKSCLILREYYNKYRNRKSQNRQGLMDQNLSVYLKHSEEETTSFLTSLQIRANQDIAYKKVIYSFAEKCVD